jgi:hypothetical protein
MRGNDNDWGGARRVRTRSALRGIAGKRTLAEEVPVAFSYDGATYLELTAMPDGFCSRLQLHRREWGHGRAIRRFR